MPRAPNRPCIIPCCPHVVPCPIHRRPSAAMRGYGNGWRRLRDQQLARHPRCAHCGAVATVADHIVPRRLGGADVFANLQSLCAGCHNVKTRRDGSYR